jgi:hypothetical protein
VRQAIADTSLAPYVPEKKPDFGCCVSLFGGGLPRLPRPIESGLVYHGPSEDPSDSLAMENRRPPGSEPFVIIDAVAHFSAPRNNVPELNFGRAKEFESLPMTGCASTLAL